MQNVITQEKTAKPFLKWVGGKTQLLPIINNFLPENIESYYEPFVGGGSVLFHILSRYPNIQKVMISDSNKNLINAYQSIKSYPEQVIIELEILQESYYNSNDTEKLFYQIRDFFNSENRIKVLTYEAALFIFLNKTCFNGLYRVNQKGKFNTSFGKYEEPMICNKDNILAVSKALQKVDIHHRDYIDYNPFLEEYKNSFWYIDSPYYPVSKTSDFTGYTSLGFTESDQRNVSSLCRWLSNDTKAYFLASNSDTPFIRDLWKDFNIESAWAKRSVNSNVQKRGKVSELLIKNY